MKIGTRMTLEEVVQKALSEKDERLRDRYLLQAVRALFTLTKYEECVKLWESEIQYLPKDNLMLKLMHSYLAGALYHTRSTDRAIEYFAQVGDIQSIIYCLGHGSERLSTVEALAYGCKYAPNSPFIEETLQTYVRKIEPEGSYYRDDTFEKTSDFEKLYDLSLQMAGGGRSNNPAMWYYTAAFLADLGGNAANASRLLQLAENSKSSPYIDESIKVFRIYLDAKLSTYNTTYENKLCGQLKWLDAKIKDNIDDAVRRETAGGYKFISRESYYYWNDMMRRILISEVCPRMIKAGKTVRALQLANMADNRLLQLVNKREYYDWNVENGCSEYIVEKVYTMTAFRYSDRWNIYDYNNHFFEMIDSLGLNTAKKYVQRVENPQSTFDTFLNKRGYTGSDYLYDILGTQSLRNMQYKQAVEYLAKVSVAYKKHSNAYIYYEPFSVERKETELQEDFKYDFAREMYSLEQSMDQTINPNRKALLMLKYAIGIRNSFDLCWGLTQYYRGSCFWGQSCEKRDWENDQYTTAARKRAAQLARSAAETATDDEVAADIQYTLCNYQTVAQKYPNTTKGQLVRGQCDNLRNYHAETHTSR